MFLLKKILEVEKKPDIPTVSLDDPRLNEMPKVSVQSILNNPNIGHQMPKLCLWLQTHPIVNDALYFRLIDNRMLPGDLQLRDQLIQLQMYLAVKLVMQFEKFINEGSSGIKSDIQHPCPKFKQIQRIQDNWKIVLALEDMILELRKSISRNCIDYTKKLKESVAHSASLLASKDVIPPFYIPMVDFSRLDLGNDMIASLDPNSIQYVTRLSLCEAKQKYYINAINALKYKYTETPENPLSNLLATCLAADEDQQATLFEDFLQCTRTKIRAVSDFYNNPNSNTFRKLITSIIERFSIPPKNWQQIRRLCADVAAPLCAPLISFNGKGCENVDFEILGIQAAAYLNPFGIIRILGSDQGITALEGLKAITPDWKSVVNFALELLDPDTLETNDAKCYNNMQDYADNTALISFS